MRVVSIHAHPLKHDDCRLPTVTILTSLPRKRPIDPALCRRQYFNELLTYYTVCSLAYALN